MKTKLFSFLLVLFCSMLNAQTISTMAGATQGYAEGIGTAAQFSYPYGIAFDGGGAVVVTDQGNYKVRKIFSDNSTSLLAGSTYGFVNATGAAAKFGSVAGVARDGFNNTFVCDPENNCIRKITSSGVVTTFAGGTQGTADGVGTAAQFYMPYGLTIDASGNLYVSDMYNNRVRKISSAGVVTTLAGSTNGYADGTGSAAQFSYPSGIAVDASGNVYVGENCRIRKITPAGVVTTFAGGTQGYLDGNGANARFNNGISAIVTDSNNNLYVADTHNYRIRKITPSADVTTYAGRGFNGTTNGDVSVATFGTITGLAIDRVNNILYLADYGNNNIRKILPPSGAPSPQTIAEYSFDNVYTNLLGAAPFASNAGISFTTDRHGVANRAINIANTGTTATVTGLPYGNLPRTIAFWAKLNTIQTPYNMTFSYGQSNTSNACGGSFNASYVDFFGYANNLQAPSANVQGVWYHFTYTYDGTTAKIYKNGALLTGVLKTWNTLNNNDLFKLGVGVGGELNFNGAIDDLKIYNYVLSDTQISNLYTNNTLSASNFSQNSLEVKLYPNPVHNILTLETALEIQSVEIYTIQGQKVLSSNQKQINVSGLAAGMYVVAIQDVENNSTTKKIIIK
ncbi:hypothetical protein FCR2A7T_00290 [Flavobacterium cauense R2A-7]|uniref:Putative secreted protein (Por secretion system target) n=1 Tax=Flavobacterium cauense R2A-7 TaxID=1341154 RepID=V6S5N1_9FLAO|nr:LamG-like jellyroll fold domain-containing protein [Flavobacterium cauense]ESU21582.1 hypothetical protein FCR2A7T_00290 [Flavobacterium cauense R2A-7]TWI10484.1 putative secreted protein (Por secretion system target) [Flavobacterium cauense R2A-7]